MEKATVFGIKANIAAWLLAFGMTLLFGLAFIATMQGVVVTNGFIVGTVFLSCVINFASMFITLTLMLKNTPTMSTAERQLSLQRAWQVSVTLFLFLTLINPQKLLSQSWIATAMTAPPPLFSIAACLIIMKKKVVV